jgi:hypothetical protein
VRFPRALSCALLALLLGACAAGPERANDALRQGNRVAVISLVGDHIEWWHYGLTAFENVFAYVATGSTDFDRRIGEGVAARLRARGIKAVAIEPDRSMAGASHRNLPLAQLRERASRVGADLLLVIARPCDVGNCQSPTGANGITLQSRSLAGMGRRPPEIMVKNYVAVLDVATGKELPGRHSDGDAALVGKLDGAYDTAELALYLKANQAVVGDLVVAHFARDGSLWIDR